MNESIVLALYMGKFYMFLIKVVRELQLLSKLNKEHCVCKACSQGNRLGLLIATLSHPGHVYKDSLHMQPFVSHSADSFLYDWRTFLARNKYIKDNFVVLLLLKLTEENFHNTLII